MNSDASNQKTSNQQDYEELLNQFRSLEERLDKQIEENQELNLKITRLRTEQQSNLAISMERFKTLQTIHESFTWRASTPVWFLERQICKVPGFLAMIPHAIRLHGGLLKTLENLFGTLKKLGFKGLVNKYRHMEESVESLSLYQDLIDNFDTISEESRSKFQKATSDFELQPLISVIMPVYNPPSDLLEKAINSVQKQLYSNWELCIADDLSDDPAVRELLERYEHEDKRIKVVYRERNGHISESSNSALEISQGEFVALVDHDDELSEHALYWVIDAINKQPDVCMIYSDEDKIDVDGQRSAPYFKPDWNYDLFLSQNMFSHLGVYKRSLVESVGGFRKGFEGSQDYDLALRCMDKIDHQQIYHIPRVLYHWRVLPGSTALSSDEKPYAVVAGQKSIQDHLVRHDIDAEVELLEFGYRVKYEIPSPAPHVSIIIPTRNGLDELQKCISSMLEITLYENYDIIVIDNGSDEPETISYISELSQNTRISVIRDDRPFNFSALNNSAVREARGSIVGLVNNDVEVIHKDWLTELVSHVCRPGVGAVGAKLLYPDGSVQHGGVIVGLGDSAAHAHRGTPRSQLGYFGRAALIQSFSAVTGACLFVRKELYEEVGGLNEEDLAIAFNDVDFCLKLLERGYRNIWTPFAALYHYESKTRGSDEIITEKRMRLMQENDYLKKHWGNILDHDPAYNPNLTLDKENFQIAEQPRVRHVL